jgi:hypothetical protein
MGMLTREEALSMLEMNFDKSLLQPILTKLGCKLEDLPD